MAQVVLFHHALGLTEGCHAFAEDLRGAGHVVHLPDLYDGRTFTGLDEGVAHARELGFGTVVERGLAAAAGLPEDVFYGGWSLGVMPAEALALSRPGARGALLLHGAVPPEQLGGPWPTGLPLQVHVMEDDEWGDVADARELAAAVDGAELFLYPGDRHLFTDRGLDAYDAAASALVLERVLRFLG